MSEYLSSSKPVGKQSSTWVREARSHPAGSHETDPACCLRLRQPNADQFLATQLIASHVRSLMADHLADVASSDQHTVKPWLDAKLDFAAPVVDLSGDGFPLIGGRLDYLDNHSVAALVYQRRKHFINLFIWPTTPADSKEQKMVERQGYHLVHWADGDFTYWAVSDVSVGDLQNFQRLFENQIAGH